jgi:hypothetical protein
VLQPTTRAFLGLRCIFLNEVMVFLREVEHHNPDMVLSLGYRVKSCKSICFRRWAKGER